MPRTPTIWFREQTGWYMTTLRGEQHKLARTEPEAKKAFYKLMALDAPAADRPPERHTVRWLCDKFLDRTKGDKEPDTFRVQLEVFKEFCGQFGKRFGDSLKAHEVNDWLDTREGWGESTKALVVTVVKAAFNRAVAEDYLPESPLKRLKRRKVRRRDRVLSAAEQRLILGAVTAPFSDFFTTLLLTGMRPFSEAARLTTADVDWEKGRANPARHKNARKGKARVIYFPAPVLDILRRLAAKHPTGPLFRNRRGNAWKKDVVQERIVRLARVAGVPHFVVYDLRHTYITDALIRGVPVEVVAELVGSSPRVIHQHYASIDKNADALAAAAAKAIG